MNFFQVIRKLENDLPAGEDGPPARPTRACVLVASQSKLGFSVRKSLF